MHGVILRIPGHDHQRMHRPRITILAAIALTAASGSGALAQSSDEASKPPDQILADLQRDLANVKSFHLSGTSVDKDGRSTITGDVFASGTLRMRFSIQKLRFRVLKTSSGIYLYGDAAYWKASGASSKTVKRLEGRWVKVPASASKDLSQMLDGFTPKALAACTTTNLGTLKTEGTSTLGGQKVVVISDAGDKPGSSPGRIYLATDGLVLPLRIVQTGPTKPGGTGDPACTDSEDTTTSSDVRLSKFGKAPRVRAPKHSITPGSSQTGTPI
jgi:hypothetical protein